MYILLYGFSIVPNIHHAKNMYLFAHWLLLQFQYT